MTGLRNFTASRNITNPGSTYAMMVTKVVIRVIRAPIRGSESPNLTHSTARQGAFFAGWESAGLHLVAAELGLGWLGWAGPHDHG